MEVKYKKDELYHYGVKGMKWKHHKAYNPDPKSRYLSPKPTDLSTARGAEKGQRETVKNEGHRNADKNRGSSMARDLAYKSSNRATNKAPKSDRHKLTSKSNQRNAEKKNKDARTNEDQYRKYIQKGQKHLNTIKKKLGGK